MKIAIIGAGRVGRALGAGWRRRGHEILFGLRDPADPKHRDLGGERMAAAAAAAAAAVVVLATPWSAAEAALRALDLSGKTLIDCTNPLGSGPDGLELLLGFRSSGGEQVQRWAPGAAVFKSFNSTGSDNMSDLSGYSTPPAMFVAGDDAARKPLVMGLMRDMGFEALDAGPLKNARLLEPYAMLWIDQALNRGAGHDFAFAIVRKSKAPREGAAAPRLG